MSKLFLTLTLMVIATAINAQTIFGEWEYRNEDTGEISSIIEVYKKSGKAYAKIIEIADPDRRDNICVQCEGVNKDRPVLGMDILTGLSEDGDEWSGGEIIDPNKGFVYNCFIKLEEKDKLKIRGYIGISLFGRTVYWYRKQ